MQEAETFRNERPRETLQQPRQKPTQIPAIKYKAAELTFSVLKFPPTPFELIERKDNMWRWLRGAQRHLPFDDLVINMYGKLDRQWQVYLKTTNWLKNQCNSLEIPLGMALLLDDHCSP